MDSLDYKDIVFVVKSHQRVTRFAEKTLTKVIMKYGMPLERLYVFVSTDEDYNLYTKEYCTNYPINIVKAPLGVAAVDNFITDYFSENQKIIYMNDDVTQVVKVVNNKFVEVPVEEFIQTIDNMFNIMEVNGITYGGFYPVVNTMFMSSSPLDLRTNLCLIMDPLSLVINNKSIRITISDKSDFEKSIQHFNDRGAILRYNRYAFKAEYYGKIGGFQGRDENTELSTAKALMAAYPNEVAGVTVKKEGKTSLKLKNIPAKRHISFLGMYTEPIEEQIIQTTLF